MSYCSNLLGGNLQGILAILFYSWIWWRGHGGEGGGVEMVPGLTQKPPG